MGQDQARCGLDVRDGEAEPPNKLFRSSQLCCSAPQSEAMVVLCQPERAVLQGHRPPFTVSPPAPPVQKLLSSSWSLR